jgi:hypothetical protein
MLMETPGDVLAYPRKAWVLTPKMCKNCLASGKAKSPPSNHH